MRYSDPFLRNSAGDCNVLSDASLHLTHSATHVNLTLRVDLNACLSNPTCLTFKTVLYLKPAKANHRLEYPSTVHREANGKWLRLGEPHKEEVSHEVNGSLLSITYSINKVVALDVTADLLTEPCGVTINLNRFVHYAENLARIPKQVEESASRSDKKLLFSISDDPVPAPPLTNHTVVLDAERTGISSSITLYLIIAVVVLSVAVFVVLAAVWLLYGRKKTTKRAKPL